MSFAALPEQLEAKRLLTSALAEGPAHAYLLYGPPGVGKGDHALLFAAELLGDHARVARRSHPDLYVLEPLGDQIRIDDIRELRRDLHMRPFEASRRVYIVFGADTMNEDAADALLKDLEEPPSYAVMLLVANDLGALLAVARSVYLDPEFDAADAAQVLLAGIAERGEEAKEKAEESVAVFELSGREAEQRVRRAQRGAERDELLAVLEELEWWYRDLVVLAAGAEPAAVHVDRLDELRADATRERLLAAERACELIRIAWREAEELQLSTPLALEALLVRLRGELAGRTIFAV